jgi:hypothetical protein
MADGQERAAALLREQALRVEALFAPIADAKSVVTSEQLALPLEELRSIIASIDALRAELAIQERTLAGALDRMAKRSGSA